MSSTRVEFSQRQLAVIQRMLLAHGSLRRASENTGVKYTTLKQWLSGHRKSLSAENLSAISMRYADLSSALSQGVKLTLQDYRKKGGKIRAQSITLEQMNYIRGQKKDDTRLPLLDDSGALEFYGAMMGDGCISSYYSKYDRCYRNDIVLYGNSLKDEEYFDYLQDLLFTLFNARGYLKTDSHRHTLILTVRNQKIAKWLVSFGFPRGVKGELKIPDSLLALPFDRLRFLLRGFFDTDGSISARKDENYRYPYVFLSTTSGTLRSQFKSILSKQGYPVWETKNSVVFRGIAATNIWFEEVGSSNPRNKERYKRWLLTKRLDH